MSVGQLLINMNDTNKESRTARKAIDKNQEIDSVDVYKELIESTVDIKEPDLNSGDKKDDESTVVDKKDDESTDIDKKEPDSNSGDINQQIVPKEGTHVNCPLVGKRNTENQTFFGDIVKGVNGEVMSECEMKKMSLAECAAELLKRVITKTIRVVVRTLHARIFKSIFSVGSILSVGGLCLM